MNTLGARSGPSPQSGAWLEVAALIGQGAPKGTCTSHGVGHGFAHMTPGKRYRVIKAFKGFDRAVHPVGEAWTYIGAAFPPYDDGRSIFVSVDGERERHIRIQDRVEEKRDILGAPPTYIAVISRASLVREC